MVCFYFTIEYTFSATKVVSNRFTHHADLLIFSDGHVFVKTPVRQRNADVFVVGCYVDENYIGFDSEGRNERAGL